MIAIENVNTYVTGVFPDAEADNSTGAATADGFEFIAEYINNSVIGNQQDWMDYAGLTPNGVTEAAGASQIREAIQKGNAIGPGWVGRRDIYADPSVHGDRSILLAQQGVLIASYPLLDAACWVTDTPLGNNAAVAAAGGYYYRSSDAAGLTPNIAGPYLQLPPNPVPTGLRQYSESAGDFTVTGTNWTTTRAVAIPYKTVDGSWRIIINIVGDLSATTSTFTGAISGVTFKNTAGYKQAMAMSQQNANRMMRAWAVENTATFSFITDNVVSIDLAFSVDLELESIPTWVKVFDIKHAITY